MIQHPWRKCEPEWGFVPFVKDVGLTSRFCAFTPEELGVFAHLCVYQNQHGDVPADIATLVAVMPRNFEVAPALLTQMLDEFFPLVPGTDRRQNPDLARMTEARRQRKAAVRQAFASGTVAPKIRFQVLERDGFRCGYCGASREAAELDVDHIHPRADGGSDRSDNLITACVRCNVGKGKRVLRQHPGSVK